MVVFEDKDDDNEIDIEDTEEPNEIIERFIIPKKSLNFVMRGLNSKKLGVLNCENRSFYLSNSSKEQTPNFEEVKHRNRFLMASLGLLYAFGMQWIARAR